MFTSRAEVSRLWRANLKATLPPRDIALPRHRNSCVHGQDSLQMKNAAPKDRVFREPAADQRFENWNDRRALALPYFLRSTTRESRVRKPAAFSGARSDGSCNCNALEMPCLTAPA